MTTALNPARISRTGTAQFSPMSQHWSVARPWQTNAALLLIRKGDLSGARQHLVTALSIDATYATAQQALQAITPKA